ncbi:MAG: phosphate/phosphonate ABC transporter permease [Spirochaetales bacterium]|nr:phosphate/phosphonate ABC transporter permease [Spirochaetales bacterium]
MTEKPAKKNLITPKKFFKKNKMQLTIFFISLILITWLTGAFTRFKAEDMVRALPKVGAWISKNILPVKQEKTILNGIEKTITVLDQKAIGKIPKILRELLETVLMSIMASTTAAFLSFIFALMGSRTTRLNSFMAVITRIISSISRNIPVAAWAIIFLFSFGQNSFSGFLALFFYSFGFQSRVFMETIDEASASSVEALRAAGASYPQVIAHAVLPSSAPQILSWILFMIETNIRSATLVGILTASGIGNIFDIYYKSRQYPTAFLVILSIAVIVILIEFISNSLRRVIL